MPWESIAQGCGNNRVQTLIQISGKTASKVTLDNLQQGLTQTTYCIFTHFLSTLVCLKTPSYKLLFFPITALSPSPLTANLGLEWCFFFFFPSPPNPFLFLLPFILVLGCFFFFFFLTLPIHFAFLYLFYIEISGPDSLGGDGDGICF